MNSRSFFLSALVAGLVIGLLGNLPLLNLVNCVLCLWVWVGGFLAVYLYRRFQPGGPALTGGQSAGLGALAGLIGALVGVVVYALTAAISTPLLNRLASALQIQDDLPWQTGEGSGILASLLVFLVADAILYPLFGALSGFIAASLMKRPPAPAQ
jgi:ABC-type Co2+ transport system permease subunit